MLPHRRAHCEAPAVPALTAGTWQDERGVYLPDIGDLDWPLEHGVPLPTDQYAMVVGAWRLESRI